jgi:hypothetical protein
MAARRQPASTSQALADDLRVVRYGVVGLYSTIFCPRG